MGVSIECKGKTILDLKNITFDFFYTDLISIVEDKSISINKSLKELLYHMDQDIWGSGIIDVDIADYVKNKDDLINFADIVKKIIEKKEQEGLMIQAVINSLWDFHKELLKYGEELT